MISFGALLLFILLGMLFLGMIELLFYGFMILFALWLLSFNPLLLLLIIGLLILIKIKD